MTAPLTRAVHGRAVAGVCAGLAGHLSLPVTWVRVGLVVLSLMGGAGLVFYGWLWIFLPSEHEDAVVTAERVRGAAVPLPPSEPGGPSSPGLTGEVGVGAEDALRRRALWNGWQVIVGVVVLAIAVVLGLQTAGIPVSWGIVGPGGVVLLGMAVAWLQLDSLRGPHGGAGWSPCSRWSWGCCWCSAASWRWPPDSWGWRSSGWDCSWPWRCSWGCCWWPHPGH